MPSATSFTQAELGQFRKAVSLGFENAASGLSLMVNKQITVNSPGLRVIPIGQVPSLVGEPDETVVSIYLSVSGDAFGHILLILSLEAADDLVEMLVGSKRDTAAALSEMERSALAEVGNITASFFLCAIADVSGLLLQPSPPAVIVDMAGAALDVPLIAVAMTMEEVIVIDTWFVDSSHEIKGFFLMFPEVESLRLMIERMNRLNE